MNPTLEKWGTALFFLLGTTLLLKLYVAFCPWGIRIVITPSVPMGIYASKTYDGTPLARNQDVCLTPVALPWMSGRNYLYAGEVICKHTLGVPGDTVEPRGTELFICHEENCTSAGQFQATDYKGRPARPAFTATTVIPANHYYFGATHHPRSFDSRYLGLQEPNVVRVRTWPLWTF